MKRAADLLIQPNPDDSSGFTIIEFAIASVVLVVGLMGFVAAIVTSQVMVRATHEVNAANNSAISAIEKFRRDCVDDFTATVTSYKNMGTLPMTPDLDHIGAIATVTVISDETALLPPLDLNGDGDTADTDVPAAELNAAILRLNITWKGVLGNRSIEHTAILAKGDL